MERVRFFSDEIGSQMWHGVEKIAFKNENLVRCLALPLGLTTLVENMLALPAVVEQSILTVKSNRAYKVERDPSQLEVRKKEMKTHLYRLSACLVVVPILPLIAVIEAVVIFVKTLVWPLKTAKIEAARAEVGLFVKNERFSSKLKLSTFEEKVVEATFNRFKQKIRSAKSNGIKEIYFVDEENSRRDIIAEIALKKQKFNATKIVYKERRLELRRQSDIIAVANLVKIQLLWIKFKNELIKAMVPEVPGMEFKIS